MFNNLFSFHFEKKKQHTDTQLNESKQTYTF